MTIRQATKSDAGILLELIKELAKYEKMLDQVVATIKDLETYVFDTKHVHAILLTEEEVIGFALYYYHFSTFTGKPGLYLEDVYIKKPYRHKGYGKQVFKYLTKEAMDNACKRMEWVCLNWNQPSIDFYLTLGAKPLNEWTTFRLDESDIKSVYQQL
ncbi:MAG: GNAT family N-acetyltransferase [Acholeplasmataceae bacterium]